LPTTYFHVYESIQMPSGEAVPGADIHVHIANDTTTVAVYSTPSGSATRTQPFHTDANGMMDFYARPGVYDIVVTHAGWAVDDTLENFWVGGGSTALADSLILLGDPTSHKATLQFGTLTDTAVNGRFVIPINGLVRFMRRDNEAQRYTDTARYIFELGDEILAFQELTALDWNVALRDSAKYNDRPVLMLDDTNKATANSDAYQGLMLRSERADSTAWRYSGDKGVWGGVYGSPNYGIRIQTDIPDSSGAGGQRDAVQLRWHMVPSSNHIHSEDSSFLTMYEQDFPHYKFRRDAIELRMLTSGSHSWATPKHIVWYGNPASNYGKMGLATAAGNLTIYAGTVATVDIRTQAQTDAATLDVSNITTHTLVAGTSIAAATWKFSTVTYKGNLPAAASTVGGFYNDASADTIWYSNGTTWTKVFPP